MRLLLSELRLRRLSLFGWCVGVAALVVLVVAFYPSVQGNDSLDSLYADLPPSAQGLLGGTDLTSPAGYLSTQLYAFFLPAVVLIFAVGRGAASLAGDEEGRTLDLLLAQPVTRTSAYLQKAAAVVVGITLLTVASALPILVLNSAAGFHIAAANVIAISVQMGLFCIASAMCAQAIAATFGRRVIGTAAVSGYLVVAYLIYGLAPTVDALQRLLPLSLWRWYLANDPLRNGLGGREVAVLVGVSAVACGVGLMAFRRRDLKS